MTDIDWNADKVEIPVDADVREVIFQALGAASMCWEPRPGNLVFDSDLASKIGEGLIGYIDKLLEQAYIVGRGDRDGFRGSD